jgi:hypothetical protein
MEEKRMPQGNEKGKWKAGDKVIGLGCGVRVSR